MKPLFIPLLISFLFLGLTSRSQSVTEKDFRLMIDGKIYSDTVNLITVSDLLKMKTVTVNFTWINVKSLVIYYQPAFCEASIQRCTTNILCNDAKDLTKKMKPGDIVGISADEAVNRQGVKVYIKEVFFRIK
ncbi:hypothetical protein ESA94_20900 [Lacibacter luteus]|uniref:Uncharacterized protein n=1 Tax=Lacibacter luteus TaxID=2508719 RepID=A0A4Q1CDT4_9BACT|nr:hypothetical protein [Lacibacter luteus]RXK57512.1 hypothetical protein ESA94_20900 [Lacibacter luteus]